MVVPRYHESIVHGRFRPDDHGGSRYLVRNVHLGHGESFAPLLTNTLPVHPPFTHLSPTFHPSPQPDHNFRASSHSLTPELLRRAVRLVSPPFRKSRRPILCQARLHLRLPLLRPVQHPHQLHDRSVRFLRLPRLVRDQRRRDGTCVV